MKTARKIPVALVLALGVLFTFTEASAAADDKGWIALFDGKSLDGWTNPAGQKPSDGWAIQDGALVRKSKAGDIWTRQRYGDFVLEFEFQTQGNSGVFIRTDN